MSTHDRLLTNTTNRLSYEHEETAAVPAKKSSILVPTPIHHSKQLPFLANREQLLQQQIKEAQQEQLKMIELFQAIRQMEAGQIKYKKKSTRRCNRDILQRLQCPQENCQRCYSTEDTLNRHMRQKHQIVKHSPPEVYCDLSPWPNLPDDPERNQPPDKDPCEVEMVDPCEVEMVVKSPQRP